MAQEVWRADAVGDEALKLLEEENARLKRLVADLSLDKVMLQDVVKRNVWSAPPLQGFCHGERRQFALTYPASREWVAVATRP